MLAKAQIPFGSPRRRWRRNEFEYGGAPVRRETPDKKFFLVVPLHFFGSKSKISRFGKRFRDGQYSSVSFLFAVFILTVPPRAQPFVKVGKHVSPVPYGVGATARHVSTRLDTLEVLSQSSSSRSTTTNLAPYH